MQKCYPALAPAHAVNVFRLVEANSDLQSAMNRQWQRELLYPQRLELLPWLSNRQ